MQPSVVFAEPWEAEAFALAVELCARGHFTWSEWSLALGAQLRVGQSGEGASSYYQCWLTALERLIIAKNLSDPEAIAARTEAWALAHQNAPHAAPVELNCERAG